MGDGQIGLHLSTLNVNMMKPHKNGSNMIIDTVTTLHLSMVGNTVREQIRQKQNVRLSMVVGK